MGVGLGGGEEKTSLHYYLSKTVNIKFMCITVLHL